MDSLQNLKEFIIAAEKSRKYNANTASSYRTALKYFEAEANEDEKQSLELFNSNLQAIYQNVSSKNRAKMSASSLEIYKRRIIRLLSDFEKYGSDPAKMSSWVRPPRQVKILKAKEPAQVQTEESREESSEKTPMNKFEVVLRPNAKAVVITPIDMTKTEAEKVKNYVEYLKNNISVDEGKPVSASSDGEEVL